MEKAEMNAESACKSQESGKKPRIAFGSAVRPGTWKDEAPLQI
jgi:hypothetical protein